MRELTEAEYKATFSEPMRASEGPWPIDEAEAYVRRVLASRGGEPPAREPELDDAYLGGDGRHAHLLFWYGVPNVYIVLVLVMPEAIMGHYWLDLNEKYGLPLPIDRTWWPHGRPS